MSKRPVTFKQNPETNKFKSIWSQIFAIGPKAYREHSFHTDSKTSKAKRDCSPILPKQILKPNFSLEYILLPNIKRNL